MTEGITIIRDQYGLGRAAWAIGITGVVALYTGGLFFHDGVNGWLTNQAKTPENITAEFNGHTARCQKLADTVTADSNTQQIVHVGKDAYVCPAPR
jgi:hypothetical protein